MTHLATDDGVVHERIPLIRLSSSLVKIGNVNPILSEGCQISRYLFVNRSTLVSLEPLLHTYQGAGTVLVEHIGDDIRGFPHMTTFVPDRDGDGLVVVVRSVLIEDEALPQMGRLGAPSDAARV